MPGSASARWRSGSAALSRVTQAEAGGATPSIATLQRFAEALGCDLELAVVPRDAVLRCGVPAILRLRACAACREHEQHLVMPGRNWP